MSVTPCGGNVVGTWDATGSCLKLAGDMDVSILSLACPTVPVTGSLTTTGSYELHADGTYTDNTKTSGMATFPLADKCLVLSSVPTPCEKLSDLFTSIGWTKSVCVTTGGQCNCTVTAENAIGMGYLSGNSSPHGNYKMSGTDIVSDDLSYAACVSGDTLTVTPHMSSLSGSITLKKNTSMGTGGAGGTSSTGGAGGSSSMGGKGGTSMGGSSSGGGGAGSTAGGVGPTDLPCDIYKAANTACVAAHSTIRALLKAFSGPLYQVKRADGMTKDIPTLSPGGFADSAQQDMFCSGSTCTITKLYDQSGKGNTLDAETPDLTLGTGNNAHPGHSGQTAASATQEKLSVGGHMVYSLYTKSSQAYWHDGSASGMPKGAEPQGIYVVTSGKHFNGGCCYDYGNSEVSRTYVAGNTMDALYFGSSTQWGSGNSPGPWVMADLEGGVFSGASATKNDKLLSQPYTYVTAMEKNDGTSQLALKAADATSATLNTYYSGKNSKTPGQKQGAIVLGSGGDCCYSNNNASQGTFYEGAIVAGYPSDATDNAVHANIVSAGYGK